MKSADKIPVSLYQLNLSHFSNTEFESVVNQVISVANRKGMQLNEEKRVFDTADFLFRIYSNRQISTPKWRKFLKNVVDQSSTLLQSQNITNSFLCFIGYDREVFCITGGRGIFIIESFVNQNFGLDVLVRLIKKDTKSISSIQDRAVTGNILGQFQFYRGNQRFSDQIQFGKIFTQIKSLLESSHLKQLGVYFESKVREKTTCIAKNSFRIGNSVDFHQLLDMIRKISSILKKEPNFLLNKVYRLTNKKDGKLITNLNEHLTNQLYDEIKSGIEPNIDFCHKDYDNFLTAEEYKLSIGDNNNYVSFNNTPTLFSIVDTLNSQGCYLDEDSNHFKHSVLFRNLESYNIEGIKLTQGQVIDHIHGEFTFEGTSYFRIDGEWYQIFPGYVKELNTECQELIRDFLDENLLSESFDIRKREDVFNRQFLGRPNFLVLDTITPENIEPCDILLFQNELLYLIHVKKGFKNSIRDLSSQILISANRIRQDIKSDFSYLRKVESALKRSNIEGLRTQQLPKKGLKGLFEGRRTSDIVFCLAFVDTADAERQIKYSVDKFSSNIAKFSLLELKKNILSMDFRFKIIQLGRKEV